MALDTLGEALPPLSQQEAIVEANRCLFCYDAPCARACPTHIDIPRFIKKIATGNLAGSARAIFDSNLLGATCARVCPVQELCEGACVLGSDHKPISIGRLQRYAMDYAYRADVLPFAPPESTRTVAVVGAGPAGLSCAGELRRRGHKVTVFEAREFSGGLSTYGIIGAREPVEIALAEVTMLEKLGVTFHTGQALCRDVHLAELQKNFDAVFLAVGLGHTPRLDIIGEEQIVDGLAYIEWSKMAADRLPRAEHVLVIGGGNTAIDCATVAIRNGAPHVTIVYRRTSGKMSAYGHEIDFARREGIQFLFELQPAKALPGALICHHTRTGEEYHLPADLIVKAIGQVKPPIAAALDLETVFGHIQVNGSFETNLPGVFAGGDAIRARGACSTVMAVQDGKLAAAAIHKVLTNS